MKRFLAAVAILSQAAWAQGLNLGGTQVPKDKIIVYLLLGHSNMAGVEMTKTDAVTHPHAWKYNWMSDKQWVLAKETPGNFTNGLSTRGEGGPGMPFLKGMAAAYPQYYFGIVSNASQSATLHALNTGSSSGHLPQDSMRYWKGISLYNELLQAAKEVKNNVTFGGMICMLGTVEATRTTEEGCRAFSADAAQMVSDFRQDLGVPNLPFIIGEYEAGASGNFALTKLWPQIVDQQIKLIPSKLALSATVNSVGIPMRDDHHYTPDVGQPEFAKRVVAVIQSKGWGPGASSALFRPLPAYRVTFQSRVGIRGILLAGPGNARYFPDGKIAAPREALPGS